MRNITYIYEYLTLEELIKFLGLTKNILMGDFKKGNKFPYRGKNLIKSNGKIRHVDAPIAELKSTQRLILKSILEKHPIHESCYGLGKKGSIKDNALYHSDSYFKNLMNLDIENFFPNINYLKVKNIFKKLGFNNSCSNLLTKLTTYNNSVPQGAPTSSYISGLILFNFDKKISELARKKGFKYSRYIDDITISGVFNKKDKFISQVKRSLKKEGFRLNDSKEVFFKKNEIKEVNGVTIKKSRFDISDKKKNLFQNEIALSNKVTNRIKGILNFCLFISKQTFDEVNTKKY